MSKKNLEPAPIKKSETAKPKRSRSDQSRINGAKSKGPVTPEGKIASSRNAVRHGLTANVHTILADESPDQYNEALAGWVDDLRPATKTELRIVEQIANIHWRLERFTMMETGLLNVEMALSADEVTQAFTALDPIGHLAAAWKASVDKGNALELLRRYLGTLQSQFNAMFKSYRALESRREDPRRVRDRDCGAWERQTPKPFLAEITQTALAAESTHRPTAFPPPAPAADKAESVIQNEPESVRRAKLPQAA